MRHFSDPKLQAVRTVLPHNLQLMIKLLVENQLSESRQLGYLSILLQCSTLELGHPFPTATLVRLVSEVQRRNQAYSAKGKFGNYVTVKPLETVVFIRRVEEVRAWRPTGIKPHIGPSVGATGATIY